MQALNALFERVDLSLTEWMALRGIGLLRISLGIVFFWFGILKFFPNLSPAEELATRTIDTITFWQMSPDAALRMLAIWECLIGLGLIAGAAMRVTLLLLYVHLLGTIAPLFLFPHEAFVRIPFAPTLEGQYIIKNLVLISSGIVIGATVRGGRVIANPEAVRTVNRTADGVERIQT